MQITKCDKCRKEIKKDETEVVAGTGAFFSRYTFCAKCGAPILVFLKKLGLLEKKVSAGKSN